VPSSTFSSSARAPRATSPATLVAGLALAGLVVGALEGTARAHGMRPWMGDSPGLLALAVRGAQRAGTDAVVVVGSSRARAAIDVPTLAAALGRPVFQLAQDGVPCGPMLDALARDERFHGTVLCTLEPTGLFGTSERDRERTGLPRYDLPRMTWADEIDLRAGLFVRTRLAVLSVDPRHLAAPVLGAAAWPAPRPETDPLHRASALDFSRADTAGESRRWARLFEAGGGATTPASDVAATAQHFAAASARIEARGGAVVFVELPGTGRVRDVEDRRYPRATYWDAFVAQVGRPAFTARDVSALEAFRLPDDSHLAARDAPAFTTALTEAISQRVGDRTRGGTSGRPGRGR
jgi:hypothetical protein